MSLERIKHVRTQVGEVTLHHVELGEGPVVLLLHGFPESWYGWRKQLSPLAEAGYRVIAPDLRGFGESDKPEGVSAYTMGRVVEDLSRLLDTLGQDAPARVVGHDWGGVAAWYLAMHHPRQVERVAALAAPHPAAFGRAFLDAGQWARSAYMMLFQLPVAPELLLRAGDFALLRRVITRAGRRPGVPSPEELERTVTALREPGALRAGLSYYRAFARHPLPPLRTLDMPAYQLLGAEDPALKPELMKPELRWAQKLTVEVLPDAGHFLTWERPDEVNARLLRFFGAG